VLIEMSPERFDELVEDALDAIPGELARLIRNVVVLVEDQPPAGEPGLLGCYEGVALTEQDAGCAGELPARILIFRQPLLAICDTPEQLAAEIRITVVHEVAHHFGISDERLHQLGYA
jgi:predicted Zn-dependent protease with MMP-like domain